MRLRLISIGSFMVVSLLSSAFAQTKAWGFNDELCTYKGYYDSKKYTDVQLADTYKLFRTSHYVHDEGTLEELTVRYDSVIRSVENLKIVQVSYFQRLKKDVLRYLLETADLKKTQKKAKEKPQLLIAAVKEGTRAREYAEALHQGGDRLLEAYEQVTKEQMKNNSTPAYLWHNYENTMKRADRLDRAFDYVLVYGWWNSANHLVHHINYDGTQMEQFQKLFVKVDIVDCDEP
ncbi:hypothetical protein [Sphingobacterium gobiense]|nr:hypothetical protein [Sphingobacterium gobiense]